MSHIDTVGIFARLFEGRKDAYGTEEGGCEKVTELPKGAITYPEYTEYLNRIDLHLCTGPCMGVYPLVDGFVKWGCVDFDEGEDESYIHAQNLVTALAQFGIVGWIERSRSKGYHVWIFCNYWYDAQLVREALLAACQVVDAPIKEINPKQVTLAEGQVGNYVRLPYPGNGTPGRQVVLYDGEILDVDNFVLLADRSTVVSQDLERLAELYVPPAPPTPPKHVWVDTARPPTDRIDGLAYTIWRDGPLDGSDRSDTLWKLACLLRESGEVTFNETLDLILDADRRWGKFWERGPSGEQTLTRMVSKAWGY